MNKLILGSGMFLGSTVGSYIPVLWGGSVFSLTSIFFSILGGLVGIWIGYRLLKYLDFI